MEKTNFLEESCIILAGNLKVFFDSKLETKEGKPLSKRKSAAKRSDLKEEFDSCDIWRMQNLTKKLETFRQNHSSGIKNCRLDYMFISNKLQ